MPSQAKKHQGYYVGTMTGTSGDGLDVSLIHIDEFAKVKFVSAESFEFREDLRKKLISLSYPRENEIELMGQCDTELGHFTGVSVVKFLENIGLENEKIIAIGSHGQTIRHRPPSANNRFPFTIQIGNPYLITEITDIATVADFRRRDMAAGGQGAPLVPAFHQTLFEEEAPDSVIVNIGGISNITVLGKDLLGFDTGPGNCLMDAWILENKNEFFDKDGNWASQGKINEALLNHLMDDAYFRRSPPKSTGREYFNINWVRYKYNNLSALNKTDIQTTFCELTVITLLSAIEKLNPKRSEIIVCGGGRLNTYLLKRLKQLASCPVTTSETYSINGDYIEASAFAWFAYKNLRGVPANSPLVTGANDNRVLGTLYKRN